MARFSKAEWQRAKRAAIRAAGICITCCKRPVTGKRSVCMGCSQTASDRTLRRRVALRERGEFLRIIKAHERAGDRAQEHRLYDSAAQWYRNALDLSGIAPSDRLRITEKLSKAYLHSENPMAAAPLSDWLVAAHTASGKDHDKLVRAFIDVARQLRLDLRTEQALAVLEEASQTAAAQGLSSAKILVDLERVQFFRELDRAEEALAVLSLIPKPKEHDDPVLKTHYCLQIAAAYARLGKNIEAYASFEEGLTTADASLNVQLLLGMWMEYAFAAWRLGDTERAKRCFECAILIAREHQIYWRLSTIYAHYASLLATMGQYLAARECLVKINAYQVNMPSLDVMLSAIGIPIALVLKDNQLLKRYERIELIERAFQDGNPTNIGSLVASFAELYTSRNEVARAAKLLQRALPQIHGFAWNWNVLLAIAQWGNFEDIEHVQAIFDKPLQLPSSGVARATKSLFIACVAKRKGHTEMPSLVNRAIQQFEELRWFGYAERARSLIMQGRPETIQASENFTHSLMEMALTPREKEVANLVLRGLTNRAIAFQLRITENTVEKHMGAIMGRLGVRSRYQVAEMLKTTDSVMRGT